MRDTEHSVEMLLKGDGSVSSVATGPDGSYEQTIDMKPVKFEYVIPASFADPLADQSFPAQSKRLA